MIQVNAELGSLHLKPRSCCLSCFDGSERWQEPPAMGRTSPTLRRAWPRDGPLAAICVQNVDVQCVLQFTLIHAAGCVLHRRTSRVIHRLKLCLSFLHCVFSGDVSVRPRQLVCRSAPSNIKSNEMEKLNKKPGRHRLKSTTGLFKPLPGHREVYEP